MRRTGGGGFTLIELLVVLTIFSTVVVASSDIFLLANKSQRKVFSQERIQADARYTMEAIVREIRTGQIDFGYYAARTLAMQTPDAELALIDNTNTKMRFAVSDATTQVNCPDAASTPCLLVTVGAGTPTSITPKGVQVQAAKFYISPSSDPTIFNTGTGTYGTNVQPHVTFVLTLLSVGDRAGESSVVYLQSTASNRGYKR